MNFDVVTFGSAVMDVFASTDIGEKCGCLDLEIGSKYLIKDIRRDIGGGGPNVAAAFSRFGFKTGCVCGLGNDSNGEEILKLLKSEKIKFLGVIGKSATGNSVIINGKDKDRTILTFKGESDEVKLDKIKRFKTRWIYYSSLLGKSLETQKKLATKLTKEGTKLAFNPSEYLIRRKDLRGLLKLSEVLILNKEEGELLCKKYGGKGDSLKYIYSLGPRIVVITDKDKATRCFDGEKVYSIVPNKGKKVVDRTGAGDAFGAGFVSGLIAGYSIDKCLKLGVKESEAVLGYFGAKNNLIKKELLKRI